MLHIQVHSQAPLSEQLRLSGVKSGRVCMWESGGRREKGRKKWEGEEVGGGGSGRDKVEGGGRVGGTGWEGVGQGKVF